jgi:hypothetical protein
MTIPGLSAGQEYCFKVSAYDKAGNESPKSAQACATTPKSGVSCTYTLSPTSNTYYSAEGGSGIYAGSFSVTASGSACSWSATSDSAWITITSGNSGTGNGTGTYTVSPNSAIAGRTGTIKVGDQSFTVTQDGRPCTYALSPTSRNVSSLDHGPGEFGVTTSDSSCSWTATSNAYWIAITSGSSGTGNGRVSYNVSNLWFLKTPLPMPGTITVGDQTFTVTAY